MLSAIFMTVDLDLNHLAEAVFVRFLCDGIAFFSLSILFPLERNCWAQPGHFQHAKLHSHLILTPVLGGRDYYQHVSDNKHY